MAGRAVLVEFAKLGFAFGQSDFHRFCNDTPGYPPLQPRESEAALAALVASARAAARLPAAAGSRAVQASGNIEASQAACMMSSQPVPSGAVAPVLGASMPCGAPQPASAPCHMDAWMAMTQKADGASLQGTSCNSSFPQAPNPCVGTAGLRNESISQATSPVAEAFASSFSTIGQGFRPGEARHQAESWQRRAPSGVLGASQTMMPSQSQALANALSWTPQQAPQQVVAVASSGQQAMLPPPLGSVPSQSLGAVWRNADSVPAVPTFTLGLDPPTQSFPAAAAPEQVSSQLLGAGLQAANAAPVGPIALGPDPPTQNLPAVVSPERGLLASQPLLPAEVGVASAPVAGEQHPQRASSPERALAESVAGTAVAIDARSDALHVDFAVSSPLPHGTPGLSTDLVGLGADVQSDAHASSLVSALVETSANGSHHINDALHAPDVGAHAQPDGNLGAELSTVAEQEAADTLESARNAPIARQASIGAEQAASEASESTGALVSPLHVASVGAQEHGASAQQRGDSTDNASAPVEGSSDDASVQPASSSAHPGLGSHRNQSPSVRFPAPLSRRRSVVEAFGEARDVPDSPEESSVVDLRDGADPASAPAQPRVRRLRRVSANEDIRTGASGISEVESSEMRSVETPVAGTASSSSAGPLVSVPESGRSAVAAGSRECAICFDAPVATVFVPCGHASTCVECGDKFKRKPCPICRKKVKIVQRIFLT
eukprot:TRINITY_DN23180_c0_g1_i1.p1 TRINITY_DN23180_c0_g1~~TRINITY_DN23180_c0_g1_i1.p1  ORF type:complete len:824 (+),score=119.05 TRINITY_DN23180_c0_g1_i1:309-2474(+)